MQKSNFSGPSQGQRSWAIVTSKTDSDDWGGEASDSSLHETVSPSAIHAARKNVSSRAVLPEGAEKRTEELRRSETASDENISNEARLAEYKRKLTEPFLHIIRDSDFEYGYECGADEFVRKMLAENALACKEWLNDIFVEYYDQPAIAEGISRVVAHLSWSEIGSNGITIALSAVLHSSIAVREAGVRCFENWGTQDCLRILTSVRCHESWMTEYVAHVIEDIQKALGFHGTAGQKSLAS